MTVQFDVAPLALSTLQQERPVTVQKT